MRLQGLESAKLNREERSNRLIECREDRAPLQICDQDVCSVVRKIRG